jgi:membrane protease subunit (stomatin/prohibitin family)
MAIGQTRMEAVKSSTAGQAPASGGGSAAAPAAAGAASAATKFCQECGKPIPRASKFCPECGKPQA